jgi:hypothetical protein
VSGGSFSLGGMNEYPELLLLSRRLIEAVDFVELLI